MCKNQKYGMLLLKNQIEKQNMKRYDLYNKKNSQGCEQDTDIFLRGQKLIN